MNKFRLLTAREIECRIQQIKPNGLSLLLYKDARCDQAILDETVGPMNWKREHSRENRNCTVSIWDDEKKQWVGKEDTGTESNTEAEKGLASDSFKRACVNWGIGRELYTAPFIWISADKCDIQGNKCYDRFDVKSIGYNQDREINALEIVNEKTGAVVYRMGNTASAAEKAPVAPPPGSPNYEPPKKEAEKFECLLCGKVIKPIKQKNGVTVSVRQWSAFTEKHYGQCLCLSCTNTAYPDWTQHADELT